MNNPLESMIIQAIQAFQSGNLNSAEIVLSRILASYPKNLPALNILGLVKAAQSKHKEAAELLKRAIRLNPRDPSLHYNLAKALQESGAHKESLTHHKKAVELNPTNPEALLNYGKSLSKLGSYGDALDVYKKSLQINPNYTEAFLNIGITLRDLERYDEALNFTDKAISIDPSFLEAWLNRGDIFNELARYDEALASYDKAISFKPDCADAYWNKALSQLLTGNFEDGWKNYEYRWKKTKADPMRHQQFPLLTNISEISGKSVLVWSEQGYGDTIQFSRYTEKLIELKADVIFEVQKPLKTLLQNSFLRSKVISQEESTEVIHFQIPLVSLPLLFSTNFDDIPSANSYIRVDEDNLIYWKDKLNLTNTKKNIGVACSGDKNHLNDKNRSIDLSFFEPLADKANLFLIQKDLREKDRNFLNQHPDIKFLGEEIKSFNDSASIIQAMDLVISVDTSLAHLSGALGKSTLVLLPWNPEWRWLLERQDSPWYPTAKIFRQPNKDNWEAVIKEVIFHLNLDY